MNNELYSRIISELNSDVIALCVLPECDEYTRRNIYCNWSDEQKKSAICNNKETQDVLEDMLALQDNIRYYIATLDETNEKDCDFKLSLRYLGLENGSTTLKELNMGIDMIDRCKLDEFYEELKYIESHCTIFD